jgi:hypothetical protein
VRVDVSRSLSTGATASDAACDDAHRIELAVYVWRAIW